MNFLNPIFLVGLLAVALPIIIHLINLRRPQKVAFSTLSFFNELRKSTIRRIRIKQYLLLTLRVLAILFLALALARPFLPPTLTGTVSSTDAKSVAILVDNSASMSRVGTDGPLIEQAKEIAGRIVRNGSSKDKFLIKTTNFVEATQTGLSNKNQALTHIDDITTSNRAHYTLEQFRQTYQQLVDSPEQQSILYIISDGQVTQLSDLESFDPETDTQKKSLSAQLIKVGEVKQQNIAVTSVELESQMLSPGAPITLAAEVENTGDAPLANQFVSLEIEGEMAGQYESSLQPGETKTFSFEIMPEEVGHISGQIVLEGDEVSYDNTKNFVIQIPQNRSILLVDGNTGSSSFTSYIAPAVEAAQQTNARLVFDKKQPDNVRQGSWNEYDGIVFDGIEEIPQYWHQELRQYVQEGGGILFFPSEQGDLESYNQFFARFNAGRFDNVIGEYGSFETVAQMEELEEGHPILHDIFNKKEDESIQVDLPSLYYYYHYRPANNVSTMPLLNVGNQDPLLVEQSFGEGVFIISAIGADPGWSNFPVNTLFAPLFYRTVLYASSPETGGLQQYQLGKQFEWEGDIDESDITLLLNDVEYVPEVQRKANGVRVNYDAKEWEPGILTISSEDKKNEVAVNQNIMESYFETLDEEQWHNMLGNKMNTSDIIAARNLSSDNLDEQLRSVVFGKEIWNWFIWIALLFLVTETLISRLYKAESIS